MAKQTSAFLKGLARSALFIAANSVVVPAQAESKPPSNPLLDRAQNSFAEGRALMDAGHYLEAVDKFRLAAEVKNTPGLRYHIAFCLEQAGLLVEAEYEYSQAAALLEEFGAADVAALLPEARARVAQATPRVVIQGLSPGAQVSIDGRIVDGATPVPVNPGSHELAIAAPGREAVHLQFAVELGEQRPISGALPEARRANPAAAPVVAEEKSNAARPVVFWSATAVAAAGLGTGVVGLVLREAAAQDVERYGAEVDAVSGGGDAACNASTGNVPGACDDLSDALAARDSATTVAVAGFSAAAAGAAVALVTHFFWTDPPLQVNAAPAFDANRAPTGGSISLRGQF